MVSATAPRKTRKSRQKKDDITMAATTTTTRKAGQATAARPVLTNPFKVGEIINIPAGTAFTSSAPTARGRQIVKRGHKVTVHDSIPARIAPRKSEKGSKVLVRPVRIRAKGSGGYWKDITLTEKIIRLNGKTPSYETMALPADMQETVTE